MLVADLQGARIYRMPAESKRTNKDGTPREPKRLGRVHFAVFSPDGLRVVGFMVKLPDVAAMIKQPDRFVALDALKVYEGVIAVADGKENYDDAAAKRLGINLDECLIWTGMDVVTASGKAMGYCADCAFDAKTGKVSTFKITNGSTSSLLVGDIEMPASYLKGYKKGAMVVSDKVCELELSGGAAAKAAEVTVVIGDKVKKGAAKIDEHGSKALDKGSRALGKQLGKTKGMFSSFAAEYRKAAGAPKKKKK